MTEPLAPFDALGGPGGTQLPDPPPRLPDPLVAPFPADAPSTAAPGAPSAADEFRVAPVELPAAPDARAMREAIAAALGDEEPDAGVALRR